MTKKKLVGDFMFTQTKKGVVLSDKYSKNVIADKLGIDIDSIKIVRRRKK